MNKEIIVKIQTLIFLLVVVVLLTFLNRFEYLNQIKNFTVSLVSPIAKIFQVSSDVANDFFYTLQSIDEFKNENKRINEENLKLNYEISQLKEIQKENEVLRKQINFSKNSCLQGTCIEWKMANIISRGSANFEKNIFINLGRNQNIQEGQPIVASGGLLVGKIIEVFDNYSKVMLINDSRSSINSITQNTRANGVVRGNYAAGIKLEMIDQSEKLILGDLILTSGLEEKIPKGLIIGKVSNIEETANKIFKTAEVNLFLDFNNIEEVFIVSKYD